MFDYLQQFNRLPKELKEKVSSPRAMEILSSLEKKYQVNLAMLTMQIMVKQISFKDLPAYFSTEMGLELPKAKELSDELMEKIFFSLTTYLGLRPGTILTPQEKELDILMKDNNIILPSQDLLTRCRSILVTYRKGVRTKIDTRDALEKPIARGGIGLDAEVSERLLRLLDGKDLSQSSASLTDKKNVSASVPKSAQGEIDKLISREESVAGYDLKKTLAKGSLQVPAELAAKYKVQGQKLDPSHELEAPDKIIAIEAPEEVIRLGVVGNDEKKVVENKVEMKEIEKAIKSKEVTESNNVKSLKVETEEMKIDNSPQKLPTEKVSQLANLAPKSKIDKNSFKKPEVKKDKSKRSFFSNLFKGKSPKKGVDPSPLAGMKSSHLEAMVKAASLESQMKSRPAASSDSRPKMQDVKVKPKMMGPLEELRYLDLVNFRRLGDNPEQITDKVVAKIRNLKKDGYDKMVQGVQAWRQSPVNRSYIRLMQEAISQGKTIDKLLESRNEQQKSGLSKEEITAIVNMNSKLLF